GAGGPPTRFDGRTSSDDFGIVDAWWDIDLSSDSDGDGDAGNDPDLLGLSALHTYAQGGTYAVALTVIDGRGQSQRATASVTVGEQAAPFVLCPVHGGNPRRPHPVLPGKDAVLKAVARDVGTVTYRWDFGDGTFHPPLGQ